MNKDEIKALILESNMVKFICYLSLMISVLNFIGFYLLFKVDQR